MTAAFYLIIFYAYWTTAFQELKHIGKSNKVNPGGNAKPIEHIPLWKYILYGQKRLFSIHQADFYFWIGLGLIMGVGEYIIWILFIVLFVRVTTRINGRYFYLKSLDEQE